MNDGAGEVAALARLRAHALTLAAVTELIEDAAMLLRADAAEGTEIELAAREEDAERERLRSLYRLFPPPVLSVVPHRPDLDPRASAVLATLSYARRAGIYTPAELRSMAAAGDVSAAWAAREARRYRIFLALLPRATARLAAGALEAPAYAAEVEALAREVGQLG